VLSRAAVLGLPVQLEAWFEGRSLAPMTVADFFEKARIASKPKPTDWYISPARAEPVTPAPAKKAEVATAPALPAPDLEKAPASSTSDASPLTKPATRADMNPVAAQTLEGAADAATRIPAAVPAPPALVSSERATTSPPLENVQLPLSSFPRTTTVKTGAMTSTNGDKLTNGKAPEAVPSGPDLFAQFQATTRLLLEMQQSQQQVLQKFLETQERMLLYCLQGVPALPGGAPSTPPLPFLNIPTTGHDESNVAGKPVPVPPSPGASPALPSRVPPAAVASKAPVPMPANGNESSGKRVVPHPAAPSTERRSVNLPPVKSTPAAVTSRTPESAGAELAPVSANGGPPPTEQFRTDLLQIVSERTGYPVDMLDETLPLEAGLGIDSIKTVEIFSKLKDYHVYFREGVQDEEELLAEFTRLKTLKDITDSYDRHRLAFNAVPTNGHALPKPKEASNGETADSAVERYVLTAQEASLEGNGLKKNSLTATLS
jgi:hypothetical protein